MDSKHTPGPWMAFEHEPNPGRFIYGVRTEEQVVFDDGEPGPRAIIIDEGDVSEADANLIAAAPEMLEALEFLSKCQPRDLHNGAVTEMIHKAIKKARGGRS